MSERNYILGYQNEQGEFDVFAKFRAQDKDITQERVAAIVRELFKNGTIIKNETGYHIIEKGQIHGQ